MPHSRPTAQKKNSTQHLWYKNLMHMNRNPADPLPLPSSSQLCHPSPPPHCRGAWLYTGKGRAYPLHTRVPCYAH